MANVFYGTIEVYNGVMEFKNRCKILGLEFEDCLTIGGLFWSERISKPALLIGYYLGLKFDSKDEIKKSLLEKNKVIDVWNKLHDMHDGGARVAKCFNYWNDDVKFKKSLDKILNSDSKSKSKKSKSIPKESDFFGKIILDGSTAQLIFEEDKVIITPKSGGIVGIINQSAAVKKLDVFFEDIRSVILYEGTTAMGVIMGNKSIHPYLKIDRKGTTEDGRENDFSVAFTRNELEQAKFAKKLIDDRKKQINKASSSQNNSTSVADELLKFSKMKDDGIISEEEFNEQKNKLLKQ